MAEIYINPYCYLILYVTFKVEKVEKVGISTCNLVSRNFELLAKYLDTFTTEHSFVIKYWAKIADFCSADLLISGVGFDHDCLNFCSRTISSSRS